MNPFRYGEDVTKSDFCARPTHVKRLRGYLESGHKVVVLGERRTGKTSLIVESARWLRGLRLLPFFAKMGKARGTCANCLAADRTQRVARQASAECRIRAARFP